MMMTNHMVTGAAIALVIKQPGLALPLAVLSHFVQDSLPHFGDNNGITKDGYFTKLKVIILTIDAVLATALLIGLLTQHLTLAALCAVAAASPDFVWIYREIVLKVRGSVKPRGAISRFHERVQWSEHRWGLSVEIVYLVFMLRILP